MTSIFKALIWSATLHAEYNTICETAEHESNMSYETFLWVFMDEEPRSLITNVHFLAANNAYIRKAVTLSLRDAIITTLSSPGAFQGHVPNAVQPDFRVIQCTPRKTVTADNPSFLLRLLLCSEGIRNLAVS